MEGTASMGDVEAWKRVDQSMEQGMRSRRESKRASVEFRGKGRRMTKQADILLVIMGLFQSSCDKMDRAGSCRGWACWGKGQSASNCHVKKTNK